MESAPIKQPEPSKAPTTRIKKPREARSKQTSRLDRCFVWFAKAGSMPGSLLSLLLLPTWAFLSGGLIYHYKENGAYTSLAILACVLIFCYALSKLTIQENKFRVRILAISYFSSVVALLLTTLGLELWLFKTF